MSCLMVFDLLQHGDGWLHLVRDGHDLARGPLGLMLYLPLALLTPAVPHNIRSAYLIGTSLLLAFVTLGPGYALTLVTLGVLGAATVRLCGTPGRYRLGVVGLLAVNAALLFEPQPPWLPPVNRPPLDEPLYFYIHWAGIGYLFLRTLHVLIDVGTGRLIRPAASEFFAYLLFAPTLRMGPIYRFPEFAAQLRSDLAATRAAGPAATRFATGLLRLGVMAALLGRFPPAQLFADRETVFALPAAEFIARLYVAPLSIYLWISGYVDLAVGMGRLMGFTVPENFCYPWRSTSIAEFWRRWHLTLGSWLRDYVYIPLGGNRRHVAFNYLVTFLVCGLWHGTYWSYIFWGLSQGAGLAIRREWVLAWERQREAGTPLYTRLRRWRLVASPLNAGIGWLLTCHYQLLTIAWFMDEKHAGRFIGERLLSLVFGL